MTKLEKDVAPFQKRLSFLRSRAGLLTSARSSVKAVRLVVDRLWLELM